MCENKNIPFFCNTDSLLSSVNVLVTSINCLSLFLDVIFHFMMELYVYWQKIGYGLQGRKMSKSLGNVIDPLDTIKEYGTDALRFTLATGTTPGQVHISEY